MAEKTIPLWKQELLKRKQGKLTHEKLIAAQNPKHSRDGSSITNTNTSSEVLNHRSNNTEKKLTEQRHGYNKSYSDLTKKGTVYNRNIVLDESIDSSSTRQRGSSLTTQISSVDSGPSRLDSFEDRQAKSTRNTGKHNNNLAFTRDSRGTLGISLHNREHNEQEDSSLNLNERKNDRLTMNEPVIGQDHGVDSEHIRPQDVKKMWQMQATKGETPKIQISHSKRAATHTLKKEAPRGTPPASSHQDFSNQNNTLVSSAIPKAYKSPYAKAEWCRQTSVSHEISAKSDTASKIQRNDITPHAMRLPLTNGTEAKDLHNEKVEDEHIQSVKSLLGLFGGKSKAKIGRKISDNVTLGNKTERQSHGKDYHTLENKTYASKRPGLFKHHSEPNLFFPANSEVSMDVPTSPKKSPTHEVTTEVAQTSHHVSQGIQERMTRLRRASHSNMEDMDGLMDYKNRLDSDVVVGQIQDNLESKSETQIESNQQNETVHKESGGMFHNFASTTVQNDKEKPGLSGNVNTNDKDPNPVRQTPHPPGNDHNNVNNAQSKTGEMTKPQDKHSLPEKSFHNHLSVFGSTVAKKTASEPDSIDIKEYKSENKYHGKQSNYVVESNQSDSRIHNDVVSTEYSAGIRLNPQEVKPVIKNKESTENLADSTQKKPRRKGLNVVDPLAVLQLTKDPILLKEKPAIAELGLIKESQSGRKPKVEIIKHEPDRKAKIAQVNRAWDLDNVQPSLKENNVTQKTMPASSINVSPTTAHNIPVTSIDEIPVSVIDDVANKSNTAKSNITNDKVNIGSTTYYNGTLLSESAELETESMESDEEFIPVSSVDAEVDLGPPPEIIFNKMPEKVKSCFAGNGQKQAKVSFFQHVFIHDYQSETAAAADWDFENGTSFSSYMPAAVKQYEDVSKSSNPQPTPTPLVEPPATPPEGSKYDEPVITYNEGESVDFTGSSDITAGALLF